MSTRYIVSVPTASRVPNLIDAKPGNAGVVYVENEAALHFIDPVSGAEIVVPALPVASGITGANAAPLRYAEVTLTNAQILAVRATPITIVAAPGAGKKIEFIAGSLNLNALAGVYTETADNLALRFVGAAGVTASEAIEMTGFIDQAAKIHTSIRRKLDTIATDAQQVNQLLCLHNTGDGEFGGGNAANSLKVSIVYRVVDTL